MVYHLSVDAWKYVLEKMLGMRKDADLVKLFPQYVNGEVSCFTFVGLTGAPWP